MLRPSLFATSYLVDSLFGGIYVDQFSGSFPVIVFSSGLIVTRQIPFQLDSIETNFHGNKERYLRCGIFQKREFIIGLLITLLKWCLLVFAIA